MKNLTRKTDPENVTIHSTSYAQVKQLYSVQLQSNQGEIQLTDWEREQIFNYAQKLMNTREKRFENNPDYNCEG